MLVSPRFLSLKLCMELAQNGDLEDMEERRVGKAKVLGMLECSWLGCTALPKEVNGVLKSKLCSGCRTMRYCCSECQKADWKLHKSGCKLIRNSNKD